jgi:hypothetical protein
MMNDDPLYTSWGAEIHLEERATAFRFSSRPTSNSSIECCGTRASTPCSHPRRDSVS